MRFEVGLLCGAVVVSWTIPTMRAIAQSAPLPTQATSQPPQPSGKTGNHADAASQTTSQEDIRIVGTRSRPLQQESLPATVFTQRDIERAGIDHPQDFLRLTPGASLVEGNNPADSQISIRGVSQTYSHTAEAPVGVIIDGVPQVAPDDLNQPYYDLQTIEVVKGPQNAIYGRNAVAGAVVINTLPPPDHLEAQTLVGISNGNGYRTVDKVGGPIVDGIVTGSLVASDDYLGGFYRNVTTGKNIDYANNHTVIGRVYVTPTPDLTIDLKAGYVSLYGGGLAYRAQSPGNPFYRGNLPDVNETSEPYAADLPNVARTLKNNASMRIDYQMPFGKISSVSSYSFNKTDGLGASFPYLPAPLGTEDVTQNTQYSTLAYFQELKFISNVFRGFRYQLGADYYDFEVNQRSAVGYTLDRNIYFGVGPYPLTSQNPTIQFSNDTFHTKAWELFGEATYDITRQLILDGAIRYSRNDITDANLAPAAYTTNFGEVRSEAYAKAEPRITLTYKPTRDVNLFVDWALGSLPGGFNATGSSAAVRQFYPAAVLGDIYNQETSRNFEVGFNTQWLNRRVTLNGAAYYDVLTNQQYNLFYPLAGLEVIDTIDRTRIFGGELQLDVVPARGWDVSVGVGLVDAKIESFAADPTAVGHRPPYTPDYNLAFAINRTFKITNRLTGFAHFEDTVKGTEYWEADNIPGTRSNVINLAEVRAGVKAPHWSITGFVRNLGDNRYNITNIVLEPTLVATYLAPPRIYGVELTAGF